MTAKTALQELQELDSNYTLDDDWFVYDYIREHHTINADTHYVKTLAPFCIQVPFVPVEGVHYAILRRDDKWGRSRK